VKPSLMPKAEGKTHITSGDLIFVRILAVAMTFIQHGRNAPNYITAVCIMKLYHATAEKRMAYHEATSRRHCYTTRMRPNRYRYAQGIEMNLEPAMEG